MVAISLGYLGLRMETVEIFDQLLLRGAFGEYQEEI